MSKEIIAFKDIGLWNETRPFNSADTTSGFFSDDGFALALHIVKDEHRYRQWEIKTVIDKDTDATQERTYNEFQIAYRRGKYWKKPILKTIRPRHSVGLHLIYADGETLPYLTSDSLIEKSYGAIGIEYLLGIEIPVSKGINIHFDCSVANLNFGYDRVFTQNATLTVQQRKQSGYNLDMHLLRGLKIGLGINL